MIDALQDDIAVKTCSLCVAGITRRDAYGTSLALLFHPEQPLCCLELHYRRVLTADGPRLSDKNGDAQQGRTTETLSLPAAGLSPPAGSHSAKPTYTHISHIVPTSQDC